MCPSKASRAQGRPGARQAPAAPAQKGLRERAAATGVGGITPAFPAQWFYGVLRTLLGEPAICHRRLAKPLELAARLGAEHGRARTTRLYNSLACTGLHGL